MGNTNDRERLAVKSSDCNNNGIDGNWRKSSDNNNNNNAINANDKWRLWRYECSDLRVHDESRHTSDVNKQFYAKIRQSRAEREANGPPVFEESQHRWHLYLSEDVLYENTGTMLAAVEKGIENGGQFSCGTLAKKTYFDKMIGFGFFRDGFMPSYQDDLCGDIFQVHLFGFAGDDQLLAKFDQILLKSLNLIKELPKELAESVHGVMLRSEINPGTKLTNVEEPYKDEQNLPCKFKLDVWITEKSNELHLGLMAKIKSDIKKRLESDNYSPFFRYKSDRFKHAKAANKNYGYWCK